MIFELEFNKNGRLIPQRIKYVITHEEETQDIIDKYINNSCNFQIGFDKKGNPVFKEKEKK